MYYGVLGLKICTLHCNVISVKTLFVLLQLRALPSFSCPSFSVNPQYGPLKIADMLINFHPQTVHMYVHRSTNAWTGKLMRYVYTYLRETIIIIYRYWPFSVVQGHLFWDELKSNNGHRRMGQFFSGD